MPPELVQANTGTWHRYWCHHLPRGLDPKATLECLPNDNSIVGSTCRDCLRDV